MRRRQFLTLAGIIVPGSLVGCSSSERGDEGLLNGYGSDAARPEGSADAAVDEGAAHVGPDAGTEQDGPEEVGDEGAAHVAGKRVHYVTDFTSPVIRVRSGGAVEDTPMTGEAAGVAFCEAGVAGQEMWFSFRDGASGPEDHPPGGGDYRAPADLDELWVWKGTVFDVDPRALTIDLIDAHTHPFNRAADNSIIVDPAPLLALERENGFGVALTMSEGTFAEQLGLMQSLTQSHAWLVPLLWVEPATDSVSEAEVMLRDHGFKGLKFHPSISAYDADGPLMDAFVELARQYKVPVQIHSATDDHATPERVAALAKRHPEVAIVMVHTELGAIDKHHALGVIQPLANVHAETSWTNPEGILLAMQMLDSSRTLLGTDATVDGFQQFTNKSIADSSGQFTLTIPEVIAQVRAQADPGAFENWARLTAIRLYGLRFKDL